MIVIISKNAVLVIDDPFLFDFIKIINKTFR